MENRYGFPENGNGKLEKPNSIVYESYSKLFWQINKHGFMR